MAIRWIENCSKSDIALGHHSDLGANTWLIQIMDPACSFPTPKYNFAMVSQFEFLDAEDADGFPDECKISDDQARQLVNILQSALDMHMNVMVHCHAGICRSGAVTEIGTMLGFTATERFRMPNLRVKHKMMKVLGMTYDADEEQSFSNGWVSQSGIIMPND